MREAASTRSSSAPHTQVRPRPRATTAACEVRPPRLVSDAAGRDEPGQVVGVGLLADQDDVLAARHPGLGGRGVEDQSAHGGAGRGIDSSR